MYPTLIVTCSLFFNHPLVTVVLPKCLMSHTVAHSKIMVTLCNHTVGYAIIILNVKLVTSVWVV